ncbi:MAG: DUF885 domain-containing protein [candidate division Zixibacteria bacterium]|nr:DUF885 domain-containing protein [candidate division Zixibacteria bacterium]
MGPVTRADSAADRQFERLAARFIDEFPALSPVSATGLGDHRYDGQLNDVSAESRARQAAFNRTILAALARIETDKLSPANRVDHALLKHRSEASLWRAERLEEWAWNPLVYTRLAGNAVYGLTAREFAPLPQRLAHVADRLEEFPRLFRQIRATLEPKRVPKVHAETAIKQNRGVLSVIENTVVPHLAALPEGERQRLERAIVSARQVVTEHQQWLETELLPQATGDFRIGRERFDQKLAFTLHTPLTRQRIRERADSELRRVRDQMFDIAKQVYVQAHPFTKFPARPSDAYKQSIIRAGLEMAYQETVAGDAIVETAKHSLALATEFVRRKDLMTIPDDPVEIIVMPEFRRGVSLAYCDSPGPLDVGQKTFYAVAPLPLNWTTDQVRSFMREYNLRSIHNLTIHEAMPGHFLQLAHSNRYPGKLRAVLSSGVFIEGWAVYVEQVMREEGFLDGDPLMQLIVLKWYLRGIANAIMDQAIHTENMSRDAAMRLMIEDTFQEEREAAGKWVRAQLTSTQLSTYFVGYLEHIDMREEAKRRWGDAFNLKAYHDKVMSFGSPPTRFVRSLLFAEGIANE